MRNKKAFTLVEIMIVIVIIALLVAMAIPAFERARHNSHVSMLMNDMRNIEHGADQYFIEYEVSEVDVTNLIGPTAYVKKLKFPLSSYPSTIATTTDTMTGTSPVGYTATLDFTRNAGAGTPTGGGML